MMAQFQKIKTYIKIWNLSKWFANLNSLHSYEPFITISYNYNDNSFTKHKISTKFCNLFWHLMSFLAPWNVFWSCLVIVLEVEPIHKIHPKGIFEGHLINEGTQICSLGLQWKLLVIFVDCVDHWIS